MANKEMDVEDFLERTMNKLSSQLKEREKPAVEKMLRKIFVEGKTPKEAIGFTEKEMESMYAYAYNLFTHGKFKESRLMMEHLLSLDPQSRYALGVAASFHQMKDYRKAAGYYTVAFHLSGDKQDPVPLYYMYDCFKNLNDFRSAAVALEYTILAAGDKPEHAVLKERVLRTRESNYREIIEAERNNSENKKEQAA